MLSHLIKEKFGLKTESNFYNNALPVLLVVLFWFSVSVEFSVFGDNSVPLAVGVNDAKNSRPSGKRVPPENWVKSTCAVHSKRIKSDLERFGVLVALERGAPKKVGLQLPFCSFPPSYLKETYHMKTLSYLEKILEQIMFSVCCSLC